MYMREGYKETWHGENEMPERYIVVTENKYILLCAYICALKRHAKGLKIKTR